MKQFLPRIPVGLQEVVTNLVSADTRRRSSTHFVATIGYFADPAVQGGQRPPDARSLLTKEDRY